MGIDPRKCFQVTGPPGTGKTTWISRHALIAAEKFGPDKIVVASLTTAAAFEFGKKGLSAIPADQIGTLHMICKRALGSPILTAGKEGDWNQWVTERDFSRFAISLTRNRDRELKTEGDIYLSRLTLIRSRNPMIFRHELEKPDEFTTIPMLERFHELWEEWKDEAQLVDFTDLLEECLDRVDQAPGTPTVMFGDEAQDWSKLEVSLFRDKWGEHAEKVILVGDEDQTIFEWRGADPKVFLDHPVPPENKILLSQSYRVPLAVRNCALAWISRHVLDREPVEYKARENALGGVWYHSGSFRTPWTVAALIEEILADPSQGTCMVMGSCDYMLRPLIKELRSRGIPYSNPYRAEDKSWNPLRWGARTARKGKKPDITKLDRLLAFLAPSVELRGDRSHEWSWTEIEQWTQPLRASKKNRVLAHGAKADIKKFVANEKIAGPYMMRTFGELFEGGWEGEHAGPAHKGNLDWWFDAMLASEASGYAYYRNIIKHRGQRALVEKPRLWIGTIHSFKGGEADNVIVLPDISKSAFELWNHGGKSATARLFYVAMTRAKENLYITEPSSDLHCGLLSDSAEFVKHRPRLTSPQIEA